SFFFFSSRRRHTRFSRDWSSDVCSSDLHEHGQHPQVAVAVASHRVRVQESRGDAKILRGGHRPAVDRDLVRVRSAVRRAADLLSDRKSTRLNSSHVKISYAVFCLKKKKL